MNIKNFKHMKTSNSSAKLICHWFVLALFLASFAVSGLAASMQTATVVNSTIGSPVGAGGDSLSAVVSANGRYVLFSSSANNLVLNSNNAPISIGCPPKMNVYLRDRTNATTTLVSISMDGLNGVNGDSFPVDISTNGQFVLFESSATNLVVGITNGSNNVYLRDLVQKTTTLVSVNTNGAAGKGIARNSAMTPDARYVAFVSTAPDLVAGDTNGIADVFVRDMQAGITTLVSQGATGSGVGSDLPDITPDGRYVAFSSTATNIVAGVNTSGEVYVRDMIGGTTMWASSYAHTAVQQVFNSTNCLAVSHRISDDGQYVSFEVLNTASTFPTNAILLRFSTVTQNTDLIATNIVGLYAGTDINHRYFDMTPDGRFLTYAANLPAAKGAIYQWDGLNHVTNVVIGTNLSATVNACDWPVTDPTGRFVAYWADATSLVTNAGANGYHLYRTDMQSGTTRLVDANTNGTASGGIYVLPHMSDDGSVIAFEAMDTTLVANDNNKAYDVFAVNLAANTVELISAANPDLPSLTPNGLSTLTLYSVSTNARYIAFISEATNIVDNDTNGFRDVFVRDLLAGTNVVVTADTNGNTPGNGIVTDLALSGNGRYVAFVSTSSNLIPGGTITVASNVFVRDLQIGKTVLASTNMSGPGGGNNSSYAPLISSDGRYVLFLTTAGNLVSTVKSTNAIWRDTAAGVSRSLAPVLGGTPNVAAMTSDGRYVAVSASGVYIWDTQLNQVIYTNTTVSPSFIAISPDGTRVGVLTSGTTGHVYAVDRVAQTTATVGASPVGAHNRIRFSGDSRFMVYVGGDASKTNQIYRYDFLTASNTLISQSTNGINGNGHSDSPDISPDGRFIVYRSVAGNLGNGFSNGIPNVYLYDSVQNTTTVIAGSSAPTWRSLNPVFSADSQTLVFESWDPNMAQQDGNQWSDIFTLGLYATNAQPAFNAVLGSPVNGQSPVITWTATPGRNYQVQFKNNLADPVWQVLNGTLTTNGTQASMTDSTESAQRFYRIVSY